eukprot:13406634-Alexandrium_andersonii.AAC.1
MTECRQADITDWMMHSNSWDFSPTWSALRDSEAPGGQGAWRNTASTPPRGIHAASKRTDGRWPRNDGRRLTAARLPRPLHNHMLGTGI